MNYVLSIVEPPKDGAAFGKATVLDPLLTVEATHRRIVYYLTTEHSVSNQESNDFATAVSHEVMGTERVHTGTGVVFRVDYDDRAPNACPCCGRLVNWQDHALAGSDDAYCLGCYTWGDDAKISCDPNHSAHANPWTVSPRDARYSMEVVIDQGDETGHDMRYTADESHQMWDDVDNALIAWPGLTRDQILEVTIKEIER